MKSKTTLPPFEGGSRGLTNIKRLHEIATKNGTEVLMNRSYLFSGPEKTNANKNPFLKAINKLFSTNR